MELIKVKSLEQYVAYYLERASTFLQQFVFRDKWAKRLEEGSILALKAIQLSTTVDKVERALNDLIRQLFTLIQTQSDDNLDLDLLYTCVECCTTDRLHDEVFGALCVHLEKHDSLLRKRCIANCDSAIGEISSAGVPLMAAVVELSNIDAHRNALEKLACMCTTHDLVYAELKAALIELHVEGESTSSTNSGAIVVIERKEVVALLAEVIARSKPLHLYSNIYYVQAFGTCLFDTPIPRQIYEDFSAAVERITAIETPAAPATSIEHLKHLELSDIVQLAADNASEPPIPNTLLSAQRRRLLYLITAATTQHL